MPATVSISRCLSRAEALIYFDHRGLRPGIYGQAVDAAEGEELDLVAARFNVRRRPAKFWKFTLPWGESDERLRSRVFLKYQDEFYDPNIKQVRVYG